MSFARIATCVIDHTKVPSTQANIPICLIATHADLKQLGSGGYMRNANAYDIGISVDGGTTFTNPVEIESYDASAGTLILWTKISSLSSSVDTTFILGFGDPALNTNPSSTSVWDTDFAGVWHLPDGVTLGMNDSTSHGNHGSGTGSPTAGAGQVGGAGVFASGKYIDVGNDTSLQITGNLTISAWVNPTDLSNYFMGLTKTSIGGVSAPYFFFIAPSGIVAWYRGNGTIEQGTISNGTVSTGTWTKLDMTSAGEIFINSVLDKTTPFTVCADGGTTARIGNRRDGYYAPGSLDEIRISGAIRQQDWITTTFNNEINPSAGGFYSSVTFAANGSPATTVVNRMHIPVPGARRTQVIQL